MFNQSPDDPALDEVPAPLGMRELPPQPAPPTMPAYPGAVPSAAPSIDETRATADDSVIARDDHVEGTFTSRGTVRVLGSLKGRIEAVRVHIEDGANVEADVIVDEAIVAGQFTGNLTCRQRLEAQASGRISGRVETHKLMLHEGASVEGEMHMLTDEPRDASETIRGSAPIRGDVGEASARGGSERREAAAPAARSTVAKSAPKPAAETPASPPASPTLELGETKPASSVQASAAPRRSPVAEALRAETLKLTPRATTPSMSGSANGAPVRSRSTSGTTTSGF